MGAPGTMPCPASRSWHWWCPPRHAAQGAASPVLLQHTELGALLPPQPSRPPCSQPPRPRSPPCLALTAPKQLTQHSSLESPCTGNKQTSQLGRISRASPGPQRAQQQQAQPGPGPASAGDPRLTPLCPSSSACRDAAPRASSQPHGASLPQSWSCAQTPGGVCEAGRGEGMAGGWGISLVWTATG